MKNSKNVQIKVGAFIALGTTLLVLSIFAISGDQQLFAEKYELKVKFDQVTGLANGSVVQVLGYPVGNISMIEFDPNSFELIATLTIFGRYKNKITQGSVAQVKTKGALGDKFVYITPALEGSPLKNGEFLSANTGGDFLDVLNSKGTEVDQAFEVVQDVRKLFFDINGNGQIREVMDNLQSSTKELNGILKNLNRFSKNIDKNNTDQHLADSVKRLASVLEKIDEGKGSLGALINDPTVHNNLKRLLGSKSYNTTLKSVIRTSIKESEEE
ncbi:MAG: MlaD family protein [Bdellovibrionales bacterium]